MKTSDILDKAADLIEERGWTAGQGWVLEGNPDGSELCLEGGIMAAIGLSVPIDDVGGVEEASFEPLWRCPAYAAVSDYLERDSSIDPKADGPVQPLYWWNDEAKRTAAEVIEVLRATAVVEAARESAVVEVSA